MHSPELRQKVIRMRAEGQSVRSVADTLDLSPTTVQEWSKEAADEIREASRLEMENVLQEVGATKLQRLRTLAIAYKNLERHIRNSENVRADTRAYGLLLRLDRYIKNEIMHDFPPPRSVEQLRRPDITFHTDIPMPGTFPEDYDGSPVPAAHLTAEPSANGLTATPTAPSLETPETAATSMPSDDSPEACAHTSHPSAHTAPDDEDDATTPIPDGPQPRFVYDRHANPVPHPDDPEELHPEYYGLKTKSVNNTLSGGHRHRNRPLSSQERGARIAGGGEVPPAPPELRPRSTPPLAFTRDITLRITAFPIRTGSVPVSKTRKSITK